MKYLYKYPQTEFPYAKLVEENRRRDKRQPEFELLDTGVFDEDRFFNPSESIQGVQQNGSVMRPTAGIRKVYSDLTNCTPWREPR